VQIPSRQRPALNPTETAEIWHFVWKWAVVLPAKFSTRCNHWVDSEAGVIRYWVQSPCALYLRSVCVAIIAFRGLRCHLLTCMSLKLRLSVDSTPTRFRHLKPASLLKICTLVPLNIGDRPSPSKTTAGSGGFKQLPSALELPCARVVGAASPNTA
jgi:hypothetical protein